MLSILTTESRAMFCELVKNGLLPDRIIFTSVGQQAILYMATTTTVALRKMSTKIFIVRSATTFSRSQGRIETMTTSFVLLASLNI